MVAQVITGSHDSTIKLWDLAAGKAMTTLTHHKKSVRAMCMHPKEFTFASASADNIKKFVLPRGNFLHNMLSNQRTILNSMAVNEDGIMATGGDNGSLWFWDWKSGHCFQVCRAPTSYNHLKNTPLRRRTAQQSSEDAHTHTQHRHDTHHTSHTHRTDPLTCNALHAPGLCLKISTGMVVLL